MRATPWIIVTCLAAALAAGGCSDPAEDASSADYIFGLLEDAWANARTALASGEPNVGPLYSVGIVLTQRLPRRMRKEYHRPNRQEVLAKLNSLAADYEAGISSKLMVTPGSVVMRPGVTIEELRKTFAALDPRYEDLRRLVGQ